MEIFSRVVSWIAFAVLVIVSLVFFESYPHNSYRDLSAIQIIQIFTEYLGVVIPVYCLARLVQMGCTPTVRDRLLTKDKHAKLIKQNEPRKDTEREREEVLVEAVRERNKKAYEEAMRERNKSD